VAKRSYGTGRLYVVVDRGGRASWYASWWVGTTRVKRKVGLKRSAGNADGLTRMQAERELRRLLDATTVGARGERRTVGEAGDAYIAHLETVMERKRTTIADYRGYLRRHLAPFFGNRPMDRIEPGQVERYLHAKRGEDLSPKTVQNHLNFLHGIFAFAVRRGWATANPVALVERPRAHRSAHRRIRFLQPEELEAVIRAVPADALGAVERPLYLAAAMTGLRQGELLALRWSDVDWSASRVRVAESFTRGAFDSPKSHRGRSVPMADRLAGELERHFQARTGAATRTWSSPTRRPVTCSTPPSSASASAPRLRGPARPTSRSMSCAIRSARRWPRRVRPYGPSRNGWGTPTPARRRSTRTTRPIRPAERRSRNARSAVAPVPALLRFRGCRSVRRCSNRRNLAGEQSSARASCVISRA
jgi:integrase